jgi:hypothetical protein
MNLLKQSAVHLAAGLAALLGLLYLYGWEQSGGAPPLLYLGCIIAMILGGVLSHLIHEWGHFLGTLLCGARYTVKAKPSPLFFDFDYEGANPRQYLWLSAGGPIGNLLLILLVFTLPMDSAIVRSLCAASIALMAYVLVIELPISQGIIAGKAPMEVLTTHFGQGKPLFRRAGIAGITVLIGSLATLTLLHPA